MQALAEAVRRMERKNVYYLLLIKYKYEKQDFSTFLLSLYVYSLVSWWLNPKDYEKKFNIKIFWECWSLGSINPKYTMENQQFIDKLSLYVGVEVKDELYYYQTILLYVQLAIDLHCTHMHTHIYMHAYQPLKSWHIPD